MIYGYARVSTKGQARDSNSLEAQETALRGAGATEIYSDAFIGTKSHRPQLDAFIKGTRSPVFGVVGLLKVCSLPTSCFPLFFIMLC